MATKKTNDSTLVKQIMDKQSALLKQQKDARARNTRARIDFDKKKRERDETEGRLTLLINQELLTDPAAMTMAGIGSPTEKFFWAVVADRLNGHLEMQTANQAFTAAQSEYIESEAEMLDIADELGIVNKQAVLVAAELQYAATVV